MSGNYIIDGIILYLGLLMLLTFHEFGHAWMAMKCGDNTARDRGRCSLNPLVHISLLGTVIIPLFMIFLPHNYARFLIGWAKPVPVNPDNLSKPKRDEILITMAGPWVNLMLAVLLVAGAKVCLLMGYPATVVFLKKMAQLSLVLCFFNLLPIPPLDGSHVVRVLSGMSYETYFKFARFGLIVVVLILQIPQVPQLLTAITKGSLKIILSWFGMA